MINDFDSVKIGEKLILSALKMDEAFADMLKLEVIKMKKLIKSEYSIKDLQQSNELIKRIIFAMTITDDKIRQGIQLCKVKKNE